MAKYEANIKDKTDTGKLGQEELEFLVDLRSSVAKDKSHRSIWEDKIIAANNQRLGIKRISNHPYEDAPNIPLPETDKLIKKAVPNLVLSAWAPKKMCTVRVKSGIRPTPVFEQRAKKAEEAMNMILREKMDWFTKLELSADYAKEKGHCIFRIVEEFKSKPIHKVIDLDDYPPQQLEQLKKLKTPELKLFLYDRYDLDPEDEDDKKICQDIIDQFKSGKKVIDFTLEQIESLPNIEVPLPTKVVVPNYTTTINSATRIRLEYDLSRHEIEENMDQEVFINKNMDEMTFASGINEKDNIEKSKGFNEGIGSTSDEKDTYRLHEIETWYKSKKDKRYKRMVYTFFADILDPQEALLQKIEFPFEFEDWNYEKFDNETKDPRYHSSRGVPEQIQAIQEFLERALNNMLIRDEMNNNPTYEVTDTSDIWDTHERFVPGEMLPVKQLNTEIRRINDPITVDVSSERIMQLLKAYAEEYMGNVDQMFRNATNAGGGKTLGEIQLGIRQASGPLNEEVIRWNNTLSKVYEKVFLIMKERLGDSIWVNGVEVTREDFNFPAEIRSNGQLEVADKQFATQKALMRLQMIVQPQFGDVVDPNDKFQALQDWLEKDGVKDPDRFSTSPEEVLMGRLRQLQQALAQGGQQLQLVQKELEKGQKELARTKKQTKETVSRAEGQMEAVLGGAVNAKG